MFCSCVNYRCNFLISPLFQDMLICRLWFMPDRNNVIMKLINADQRCCWSALITSKEKHALLVYTTSSSTCNYVCCPIKFSMSWDYFLELGGSSHGLFSTISRTAQALALTIALQEFTLSSESFRKSIGAARKININCIADSMYQNHCPNKHLSEGYKSS